MRQESQSLTYPFDDEGQHTDIRQNIEHRHNEEDWQQCGCKEVHLRYMYPIRESKRNTFISHADQPVKTGSSSHDNLAADGEGRQEPGQKYVECQKRTYAAPLNGITLFGQQDADA